MAGDGVSMMKKEECKIGHLQCQTLLHLESGRVRVLQVKKDDIKWDTSRSREVEDDMF